MYMHAMNFGRKLFDQKSHFTKKASKESLRKVSVKRH